MSLAALPHGNIKLSVPSHYGSTFIYLFLVRYEVKGCHMLQGGAFAGNKDLQAS